MGLLNILFGNSKHSDFVPDFNMSEYNNWLIFLENGGTSEEWERIKAKNRWIFIDDETEKFLKYQEEVKPISDRYYNLSDKIQKDWSVLYNLNNYKGSLANTIERECIEAIDLFERMYRTNLKYGESSPTNIPAFKRLAMLYEKQGRFEESVGICKQALSYGMDERGRMAKMIKKAGRKPSEEELSLLEQ